MPQTDCSLELKQERYGQLKQGYAKCMTIIDENISNHIYIGTSI